MSDASPFGRIGVFGSLFDPPHIGHLILCAEAAWQLGLDRVMLVPTGTPPHRGSPATPAETRARLAAAAASCDPLLAVSRAEVDRAGPSYMSDTLRMLARRHAGHELVLLLGADQLAALGSWHEAEQLPQLARIAVAPRPGVALAGLDRAAVEVVRMPLIDVSSTAIRERVAAGRPIRHLVVEPVRTIIERERLYRSTAPPPARPVVAWPESLPELEPDS
jgi:nicotinate-nucleotide adenylyltransferase